MLLNVISQQKQLQNGDLEPFLILLQVILLYCQEPYARYFLLDKTNTFILWVTQFAYEFLSNLNLNHIDQKSKFIFTSLFEQLMVFHKLIRTKLIRMGSGQVL